MSPEERSQPQGRQPQGQQPKGREPKGRRPLSFWQALVLIVVALIVAGLLGGKPLHAAAKDIDSRGLRALALVITTPLDAVSGWLRLDKPYEWVRGEVGEQAASTDTTDTTDGTSEPTTTTTEDDPDSTVTTEAPTTTTKLSFTAAQPLRIFLAGDSLMIEVGHAFTRKSESVASIDLYRINKVSSGFVNPDFYDWPKQLRETVAEYKPMVTVMMFGGNEKVPMDINGTKVQPFTPEWNAEYIKRITEAIKISTDAGAIVIWVGMPIMRSDKFSETARTLNGMFEQVCEANPDAYYLDAYALFSDADGKYSAYLPDSSGEMQLVREDDGIHFTAAGGDRVVEALMDMLSNSYEFE
jgi:hypothetical protein